MPKATAVFDADDSRLSGALARINGRMLALAALIFHISRRMGVRSDQHIGVIAQQRQRAGVDQNFPARSTRTSASKAIMP